MGIENAPSEESMFTAEQIADEMGLGTLNSEMLIREALKRRGVSGPDYEPQVKKWVADVQQVLLSRRMQEWRKKSEESWQKRVQSDAKQPTHWLDKTEERHDEISESFREEQA